MEKFNRTMRGYDPDEVKNFLDQVIKKVEQINSENKKKDSIIKEQEIKINDFIIIPLYHPVEQIKKSEQLEQYKRIWKYIE